MKKMSRSEELKDKLWSTLNNLIDKKIDYRDANAIASQARELCRVVDIELKIEKVKESGAKF